MEYIVEHTSTLNFVNSFNVAKCDKITSNMILVMNLTGHV